MVRSRFRRWPLAAGRWPLAAGRWPLAARNALRTMPAVTVCRWRNRWTRAGHHPEERQSMTRPSTSDEGARKVAELIRDEWFAMLGTLSLEGVLTGRPTTLQETRTTATSGPSPNAARIHGSTSRLTSGQRRGRGPVPGWPRRPRGGAHQSRRRHRRVLRRQLAGPHGGAVGRQALGGRLPR